jgi:hypothetical protein
MTGLVHRTSSGIIAGRNHTVSEVIADVVVETAALNKSAVKNVDFADGGCDQGRKDGAGKMASAGWIVQSGD